MTVAVGRDPAALAAGIGRWLAARRGIEGATVTRCEAADGGLSSDTLMVDAAAPTAGWSEALVVRLAPLEGIFPAYDLAVQARAQEVAAAHGVPTAVPAEYEADPEWLGAPFLAMPAVAGYVPGPLPLHDPWITESVGAATAVSETLVDLLAAIHGIDWRAERLTVIPARDVDAELAYWTAYLDWYGDGAEPVPALTRALEWCGAHRPASDPPASLLWGDVRLGNVIFGADRRPAAVLDWEMTTVGAAEHDLAWYLTLAATQDELFGKTVPGFLDHDAVCARYEARAGRALQSLEWFEVFAMVRSIAIMSRVGLLAERRGDRPMLPLADNPLLDQLARRISTAGDAR